MVERPPAGAGEPGELGLDRGDGRLGLVELAPDLGQVEPFADRAHVPLDLWKFSPSMRPFLSPVLGLDAPPPEEAGAVLVGRSQVTREGLQPLR